jgi:hypothetical protein
MSAVHFAHAARTHKRLDFIRAQFRPGREWHMSRDYTRNALRLSTGLRQKTRLIAGAGGLIARACPQPLVRASYDEF